MPMMTGMQRPSTEHHILSLRENVPRQKSESAPEDAKLINQP